MDIEEICQIANIDASHGNKEIIESYKDHIMNWLSSQKFRDNYASLSYPPLIDPDIMNYEGSAPEHAWVLNIPLPKYYDFVAFGSHAVGFHGALPGFLSLCGVAPKVMALRDSSAAMMGKSEQHGSKGNYIRMYSELVRCNAAKQTGRIKHLYLQLTDLVIDNDTKKFYSLVDASKCLNIVRDPISVLKGMVACPHKIERLDVEGDLIDFGLFLEQDPHKIFSKYLMYRTSGTITAHKDKGVGEGKEMDFTPCIDSLDYWILDAEQSFHDGAIYSLLNGKIKSLMLRQTNDFVGERCFDTMKEMAAHFGFDSPKEEDRWLFSKRVSDLTHLTPMIIYAHPDSELFTSNPEGKTVNKRFIDECIKIKLTTRFDDINILDPHLNISCLFETADPIFSVFLVDAAQGLSLLKNPALQEKLKIYIKELSVALLKCANDANTKKFKEYDILEYLQTHIDQRRLLKYILNQHLTGLRTYKPDIINSWEYYAKFIELCKDDKPFDGTGEIGGIKFSTTRY